MTGMSVRLLVAAAENDVIGRDGDLPWRLPADLRRFSAMTMGHAVVMGRRTYTSIISRSGHPLTGRHSIVLSTTLGDVPHGVDIARTPKDAVSRAERYGVHNDWFVIGGASVYAELLPEVNVVELTRVHADIVGDARMPAGWLDEFTVSSIEVGPSAGADLPFSFIRLERA